MMDVMEIYIVVGDQFERIFWEVETSVQDYVVERQKCEKTHGSAVAEAGAGYGKAGANGVEEEPFKWVGVLSTNMVRDIH